MVSRYGWSFQHQGPSLYVAIHPFFSGTAWHYNQMAHVLPILARVADILDCQQGQILTNVLVGVRSILKQRVERLESTTQLLWAGIDRIYFWELQL